MQASLRLHAWAPTCRALSDPPNEFAPEESPEISVEATQLEQDAFETSKVKPFAAVAAHVLLPLPLRL